MPPARPRIAHMAGTKADRDFTSTGVRCTADPIFFIFKKEKADLATGF